MCLRPESEHVLTHFFFESTFRIFDMILKILSMCNRIMVLDHCPDNIVFFKSCVVLGASLSNMLKLTQNESVVLESCFPLQTTFKKYGEVS